MQSLLFHPKTKQIQLTCSISDQDFANGWRLGIASNTIRMEDVLFYEQLGYKMVELEPNDTITHQFNQQPRSSVNLYDLSNQRIVPIY